MCQERRGIASPVSHGLLQGRGHLRVPGPPSRLRDALVRDLLRQDVLDEEFAVSGQAGTGLAPDEVSRLQAIEDVVESRRVLRQGLERPSPEEPADDRGFLK